MAIGDLYLKSKAIENVCLKVRKAIGNPKYPFYLVGSALRKPNPRDVDLLCVLPDSSFRRAFMNPIRWTEEGETGNWSPRRWTWARKTVKECHRIARETRLNIDFRYIPESALRKPHLRLDGGAF